MWTTTKILFYSSGAWKIQDQDSVSGAISLSGSSIFFFISLHMVGRTKRVWTSFVMTLILLVRAPLSWPNYLLKSPLSKTTAPGGRIQSTNFGGTPSFFCTRLCLIFNSPKNSLTKEMKIQPPLPAPATCKGHIHTPLLWFEYGKV